MDDGQLIPVISFQDNQYVRIWPIQISLSTVVARPQQKSSACHSIPALYPLRNALKLSSQKFTLRVPKNKPQEPILPFRPWNPPLQAAAAPSKSNESCDKFLDSPERAEANAGSVWSRFNTQNPIFGVESSGSGRDRNPVVSCDGFYTSGAYRDTLWIIGT
ncbi:hypothetical protein V6Z96_008282 [Aspergillus fumigatus]